MSYKVYRIGEAAKLLKVKTSVLRFWEEEFSQIRPKRTDKGQRYYSQKDMEILTRIRTLLYDEGMTISGAQKALQTAIHIQKQVLVQDKVEIELDSQDLYKKNIFEIQEELKKIRDLLSYHP